MTVQGLAHTICQRICKMLIDDHKMQESLLQKHGKVMGMLLKIVNCNVMGMPMEILNLKPLRKDPFIRIGIGISSGIKNCPRGRNCNNSTSY